MLNSHIKYNKTVLYAPYFILNADLKVPTITQFNAKFNNMKWQENMYGKLISAIPIEWRTLIQSNTSTKFIQYQPLMQTAKSIKKANIFAYLALMKHYSAIKYTQ